MSKHRLMNGYRFEYKKYDNQIFNDTNSKSIIEVILYDNLDVPIYKFRISELDCIRIIDNLTQYLYNLYNNGYTCSIQLPITLDHRPSIHLSDVGANAKYMDDDMSETRHHILTIIDTVQIANIPMSDTEMEEFIFELYFNGLIDSVLDINQSQFVDEIMGRVFGSNWFNCN